MSETAVVTPAESVASPATPAAPAVPAAPPAAASVAAPAAASPESPNLRQLREQYEATKSQLEPWQKIGAKPEEVTSAYQTFSSMNKEALELGEKLGYDANEIREFMGKDPVAVLAHLRQKAQTAEGTPLTAADAKKLISEQAQQVLKPYLDQQNEERATQAEIRGQNEFNRLLGEHFKDGVADDFKSLLYANVESRLLADNGALQRMMRGQVSDVTRVFTEEKDRLLKAFSAHSQHERKQVGDVPGKTEKTTVPKTRMDAVLSTGQKVADLFKI